MRSGCDHDGCGMPARWRLSLVHLALPGGDVKHTHLCFKHLEEILALRGFLSLARKGG